MSQQMNYDEPQQQQQAPFDNYQAGYRDPFIGSYGQKLSAQGSGSSSVTAGMRLALAIVSLCLLVPISGIVLGISSDAAGPFGLIGGLITLGVICVTIMAVNFLFNYRR